MKWIEIEEFEKLYKVSESGEVLSVRTGKLLKGSIDSYGYPIVLLSNKGFTKSRLVHRLVAEAYIPNPENKPQINHIDGDKQNNNVSNLEWCTASENMKHAFATGLGRNNKGINNPNSKLSEEEVLTIKDYKAKGKGSREIAKIMGFPISTVSDVYYGRKWGWLTHETI